MANLRNKKELAAVSRETPENTRNTQSRNTNNPENAQEYISQVSEKIEGRMTKKLSKEFSRTESRILGALCSLDDPYLEMGFSSQHFGNLNSLVVEEYPHIVTGGPEETRYRPHMVTGATEEIRNRPHMTTRIQEEIAYCSPGTSSGKQKARSTSKPHFRSENIPATVEADQILLALQQLATNRNSANFNNNVSRISKLPKSFTTTMPKFDGNQRNSNCLKICSKQV